MSCKLEQAIRRAIESFEPKWAGGDNLAVTLISDIEGSLDLEGEYELCEHDTWAQEAVDEYETMMNALVKRVVEAVESNE